MGQNGWYDLECHHTIGFVCQVSLDGKYDGACVEAAPTQRIVQSPHSAVANKVPEKPPKFNSCLFSMPWCEFRVSRLS